MSEQVTGEVRPPYAEPYPRVYTPDHDNGVQRAETRETKTLTSTPTSRALEPISPELAMFLTRRLDVARARSARSLSAAPVSLGDTLLLAGEPWPSHLALRFLIHLAELLDAAETVGVRLAPFSPRCIALDGRYLDVVPDDDPGSVDPSYVAPEQRDPSAAVDARASQYGLATLALALLRVEDGSRGAGHATGGWPHGSAGWGPVLAGPPSSGIEPAAVRVLLAARSPDPDRRFSTACDFMVALEATCGQLTSPAMSAAPVHAMPQLAPAASVGTGGSRRIAEIGVLVGLAALVGGGAGTLTARRSVDANSVAAARDGLTMAGRLADGVDAGAVPSPARHRDGVVLDAVARWSSTRSVAMRAPAAADVVAVGAAPGRGAAAEEIEPPSVDRSSRRERARTREAHQQSALPRVPAVSFNPVLSLERPGAVPGTDLNVDLRRRVVDSSAFAAGRLGAPPRAAVQSETSGGERNAMIAVPEQEAANVVDRIVLRSAPALLAQRVPGQVVARFVVDTNGHIDPTTFQLIRATNLALADALRASLRSIRYLPAESGGRHVRQTVEQTFNFTPPN